MKKHLGVTLAFISLTASVGLGQDSPSLGDAARLARQQKQQKDAQAKDTAGKDPTSKDPATKDAPPPKTTKIITNEEIPEHVGPAARPAGSDADNRDWSRAQSSPVGAEGRADALKSQIASIKNYLASMQSEIDKLNDSIHFAPGNCVANCVQWNERQVQKQQQVEQMKEQLEDQKKRLEDMQESARQQGYGSSVYDP